jgi:hypothetical protein
MKRGEPSTAFVARAVEHVEAGELCAGEFDLQLSRCVQIKCSSENSRLFDWDFFNRVPALDETKLLHPNLVRRSNDGFYGAESPSVNYFRIVSNDKCSAICERSNYREILLPQRGGIQRYPSPDFFEPNYIFKLFPFEMFALCVYDNKSDSDATEIPPSELDKGFFRNQVIVDQQPDSRKFCSHQPRHLDELRCLPIVIRKTCRASSGPHHRINYSRSDRIGMDCKKHSRPTSILSYFALHSLSRDSVRAEKNYPFLRLVFDEFRSTRCNPPRVVEVNRKQRKGGVIVRLGRHKGLTNACKSHLAFWRWLIQVEQVKHLHFTSRGARHRAGNCRHQVCNRECK